MWRNRANRSHTFKVAFNIFGGGQSKNYAHDFRRKLLANIDFLQEIAMHPVPIKLKKSLIVLTFLSLVSFVCASLTFADLYMSISGAIKDSETGLGISGVEVTAIKSGDPGKYYRSITDKHGDFIFKQATSGSYELYINSPEPFVANSKPYIVKVTKGSNVVGLDIHLEKGGSISGKVYLKDGITPAKSVSIIAYTSEDNLVSGTTNDIGYYVIPRLRETNTCNIIILPDGYKGTYRENISILRGEITQNSDVILDSNLATGIVGSITTAEGTGISDATVFVYGEKGWGKSLTNSSGSFSISGLDPGTYNVVAAPYETLEKLDVQVFSGQFTNVNLSALVQLPIANNSDNKSLSAMNLSFSSGNNSSQSNPAGAVSVTPDCTNTSIICDKFGPCDTFSGAKAKCFCKCAGNDPWSQVVRCCLRKALDRGMSHNQSHALCYAAATLVGPPPISRLSYCYGLCRVGN